MHESCGAFDHDAAPALRLIVSGEDAGNKPFREDVPAVMLQGRDCAYESRLQIQPGSSLMVEIPAVHIGEPPWRAAAIVESVSPAASGRGLFRVSVVLGRAYDPPGLSAVPAMQKAPAGNPIPPSPAATSVAPFHSPAAPAPQTPKGPVRQSDGGLAGGDTERIVSSLRPIVAQLVREAAVAQSEKQMNELRGHISQELERAVEAPVAELTQYATALPAINEQIIRRTVEQASEQQLVRTTAALRPAITEMVREAVTVESGRQTRELKSALSREIESAIQEPLAVMAQYTQSLPAIDEETVRRLVAQAAQTEFERAIVAIQPAIAEILRAAIAAEYERQTQHLKNEIFIQVGKAVEGPLKLHMAAMIDAALAARTARQQRQSLSVRASHAEASVLERPEPLRAELDSSSGPADWKSSPTAEVSDL